MKFTDFLIGDRQTIMWALVTVVAVISLGLCSIIVSCLVSFFRMSELHMYVCDSIWYIMYLCILLLWYFSLTDCKQSFETLLRVTIGTAVITRIISIGALSSNSAMYTTPHTTRYAKYFDLANFVWDTSVVECIPMPVCLWVRFSFSLLTHVNAFVFPPLNWCKSEKKLKKDLLVSTATHLRMYCTVIVCQEVV